MVNVDAVPCRRRLRGTGERPEECVSPEHRHGSEEIAAVAREA